MCQRCPLYYTSNSVGTYTALGEPTVSKHQKLSKLQVFCRTVYHLATPAFAALARSEHIYKQQRFSDHAPVTVDYVWTS